MSHWTREHDDYIFTIYTRSGKVVVKCRTGTLMRIVANRVAEKVHGKDRDFICFANRIMIDLDRPVQDFYGKQIILSVTSSN